MRKRRAFYIFLTTALIILITFPIFGQEMQQTKDQSEKMNGRDILRTEKKSIQWLKAMVVPNSIVQNPAPIRRRFMLSYRIPQDDPAYPYLYSRSFIYDDALGVIAFTMAGEYRYAEQVLGALQRNLREDGSLFFAYNTNNIWPDEEDHEGAMVRTGAVAWVGYAATFYLAKKLKENENFIKEDRLARDFLAMAEKIASFMLENQVRDPVDKRFGLVTGGWGEYTVRLTKGSSEPEEVYADSRISWASMEHNIDVYFFLRDLYRITGRKEYLDAERLVKDGLFRLWNEQEGQLFRGIKGDGSIDTALPLDGASWASIFFSSLGEEKKAKRCLKTVQDDYSLRFKGIPGYRPYHAETVYEDRGVNAYYFPENPQMRWEELGIIWLEGSFGVAAANVKVGNCEKAQEIIRAVLPLNVDGGFRYATEVIPYQFNIHPSIASTAWFVITVEIMRSRHMNTLFWGR
jgi:hypothetical protein